MTPPNPLESAATALCQELAIPVPTPDARARYELRVGDSTLRLGPWGDGEVILEGAPGRGLTVTILLPRADRRVRFLQQGDFAPTDL